MQRVHISPPVGDKAIDRVTVADVETVAAAMLDAGLAPKTVRNVLTFLHSVFEHAIDRGWASQNPVRRASRPKRRRSGDANPDLQFLTVPELEAVLRAIADNVVVREPAPTRNGRAGSAPPVPPDVLGPVIRVVILTAAMTGLRHPSCSACAGATSTGLRSASASATRGSAASTQPRASPISPPAARSRWPTASHANSIAGRGAPSTAPTTTSSSPIRSRDDHSTARS